MAPEGTPPMTAKRLSRALMNNLLCSGLPLGAKSLASGFNRLLRGTWQHGSHARKEFTARQACSTKRSVSGLSRAPGGSLTAACIMGRRGSQGPTRSPGELALPNMDMCSAERAIAPQDWDAKWYKNAFNSV